MSPQRRRSRQFLSCFGALLLLSSQLNAASASGLDGPSEAAKPVVHVVGIGDELLTASSVPPLLTGSCAVSSRGPLDGLSDASLGATIDVRACKNAVLTDLSTTQIAELDSSTDLVVIGARSVEFEWDSLFAACVALQSRSATSCNAAADEARAAAANAFFSWRGLLSRIERTSPDATILVFGAPRLEGDPVPLGSRCCQPRVDGLEQLNSVLRTSNASRRAAVESAGERVVFADISNTDVLGENGSLTAQGAAVLRARVRTVLPDPLPLTSVQPTEAVVTLIVDASTSNTSISGLEDVVQRWFAAFAAAGVEPRMILHPLAPEPIPEPEVPDEPSPDHDVDPEPPTELPELPHDFDPEPPFFAHIQTTHLQTDGTAPIHSADALLSALSEIDRTNGTVSATARLNAISSAVEPAGEIPSFVVVVPAPGIDVDVGDELNAIILSPAETEDGVLEQLPSPDPLDDGLQLWVADEIAALVDEPVRLQARVSARIAADVHVTWTLGNDVIATGADAELPPGSLPTGEYELLATAESPASTTAKTTRLVVSIDGDGTTEADRCPEAFDPAGTDTDSDGTGDACDQDDDNDTIPDSFDPCPSVFNNRLVDDDLDGVPNRCDSDPLDGPGADYDLDGLADVIDSCPMVANHGQADSDGDGRGDACDRVNDVQCTITGTAGNDRLVGTAGDDIICGLGGDDLILGRGGDDRLLGGEGNDVIRGDAGADTIVGADGNDVLYGNAGADHIVGGPGDDRVFGGLGLDVVSGGPGSDRIEGNESRDHLFGGAGNDRILAGEGPDVVSGGDGNDWILGNEGDDLLADGGGRDSSFGGLGNDTIVDQRRRDLSEGNAGEDLVGGTRVLFG